MSSSARITDTGRKGDLRIGFGFERVHGQPQPCMYLFAARAPRQMAMVPLRLMYLFDERERHPITKEPICMPEIEKLAQAVYGGIPSRIENYRVLEAVSDFMTDLKNMPPPATYRNPEHLERLLAERGYDMVK